jgi:hypothetical protein
MGGGGGGAPYPHINWKELQVILKKVIVELYKKPISNKLNQNCLLSTKSAQNMLLIKKV